MSQNRTKQEITRVAGVQANYLTKYLEEDKSLESLSQHVVVPRIKLIQSQTELETRKRFGEGTAIVRPGDAIVWQGDDKTPPFQFVCQHFFSEYCKWADRRDKSQNMIITRTYDPTSELAKICADSKRRNELYPGQENKPEKDQWRYSYIHHFCFPGVIYGDHPISGTPCVLTFERGEWIQGRAFMASVKMRRVEVEINGRIDRKCPPLWAQVWAFKPAIRQGESGSWYGFDYFTPEVQVISPEESDTFQAANLELQRLHLENKLRVDHDSLDGDTERVNQKSADDPTANSEY